MPTRVSNCNAVVAAWALVVPRTGTKLDLGAVEEHCRLHLGKHKRPRQIEVVAELPKNFLGKVLRRRLREGEAAATSNGNVS